jgi:hypothetical protein
LRVAGIQSSSDLALEEMETKMSKPGRETDEEEKEENQ